MATIQQEDLIEEKEDEEQLEDEEENDEERQESKVEGKIDDINQGYIDLVKKLDYVSAVQYFNKLQDSVIIFETYTKAKIIQIIAEKLESTGYPLMEIKSKITEDFQNRISERHIARCLPDRFKNINRVIAHRKHEQDIALEDKTVPKVENSLVEPTTIAGETPELTVSAQIPQQEISPEYVKSLEKQVKALKSEIPYTDMLATMRIVKLDKVRVSQLQDASKSASKHVILMIDTRTNEVSQIYSDRESKKRSK